MQYEKTRIDAYETYPNFYNVISFVADGLTTSAACHKADLPVYTFLKLIKEIPELSDAYREAQQRGFDAMADALLEPETHPIYGVQDPRKQRILSDNIKWLLSKRQHKRYGDKFSVRSRSDCRPGRYQCFSARTLEHADLLQEEDAVKEKILPPPPPLPRQRSENSET